MWRGACLSVWDSGQTSNWESVAAGLGFVFFPGTVKPGQGWVLFFFQAR